MEIAEFKHTIKKYTSEGIAYVFFIDYETNHPYIYTLEEAAEQGIFYDIKGVSNIETKTSSPKKIHLKIHAIDTDKYRKAFQNVMYHIQEGNTYLLNLTMPSGIESKSQLSEIFESSNANYKLFKEDEFVVFSPECFIQIKDNKIFSYPMKGTIDANVENAKEKLLSSKKELWEHNTIVDLIRNDLSMVAHDIKVTKFRYLDKIVTNRNAIYQSSSEICGKLQNDWKEQIDEILFKLLPAGSISGAPKQKTLDIISESEIDKRGYYTGIFGIFDGHNLDSAVSIRFIEQKNKQLIYRSGGGITFMSQWEEEYQELIDKIYVPTL